MSYKNLVPNRIKDRIKAEFMPEKPDFIEQCKDKDKILVFLCGFYQNLGDMAITMAQKKFLSDIFPNHEILLIPSDKTFVWMKSLKSIVKESDIITILGGGNMSDKYPSLEDCRRFVISSFKKNKIVSFPQTCDFSVENPSKEQMRSIKVYNKHENLTLAARESITLDRMEKIFPDLKVIFCPDTVLYLSGSVKLSQNIRDGAVFCFRDDCEQLFPDSQKSEVLQLMKNIYGEVKITDTTDVPLENCTPDKFVSTLNGFWDMLKQHKIVVTDRLHCMIFCVLTATPCIAFDNANRKISKIKKAWLNDVDYISVHDNTDISNLEEELEAFSRIDTSTISPPDLTDKFNPLKEALLKE